MRGTNTLNLTKPYRVQHGKKFRLKDFDPADTQGLDLHEEAHDLLQKDVARLSDMQQKLYAQDRWAVLIVIQAMDAAGKDSVIRHVMSGINPQGYQALRFTVWQGPEQDAIDKAENRNAGRNAERQNSDHEREERPFLAKGSEGITQVGK